MAHVLHRLMFLLWVLSTPAFSQAPVCADGRTIRLVKDIFAQSIERQAAGFPQGQRLAKEVMALIKVEVHSVRTAKANLPVGKNHCQGVLEIGLSQQGAAKMNNPRALAMMARDPEIQGIRFSGRSVSNAIRFSSQLTDDGKEQVVEAIGHQMLAELVFQLVGPEAADRLAGKQSGEDENVAPTVQWDHEANIQDAVKATLATYRKSGMAGVVGLIEDCHKGIGGQKGRDAQMKRHEYCACMDLAAYRIDSEMAKRNGFPATVFFTIDNVTARIDRSGAALFRDSEFRAYMVGRWSTLVTEALNKQGAR